jgi:hypothetical protein
MGDWWIIAGHWTPGGTPHRAARLPTDAGEVAF